MMIFENPSGYYSVQVPEAWVELALDGSQGEVFNALDPMTNSDVLVVEEDVLALGIGELSLGQYADVIESQVLIPWGAEDITREMMRTERGLAAIRFEMSFFTYRVIRFIHISEDNLAINITYTIPSEQFDQGKRLAEYSFNSIHVN